MRASPGQDVPALLFEIREREDVSCHRRFRGLKCFLEIINTAMQKSRASNIELLLFNIV